ncbi:hypothetical protein PsYK624_166730 [Phanerochaete sordida]|uniref:Uncharacterized protein n=1 Tax=Phanerochaete sordida TaxID=48140 RepID=A0A9P3GR99_9APHY|nr:hypothetical protein PsYK624_166730 [Phanerochaete sordida]
MSPSSPSSQGSCQALLANTANRDAMRHPCTIVYVTEALTAHTPLDVRVLSIARMPREPLRLGSTISVFSENGRYIGISRPIRSIRFTDKRWVELGLEPASTDSAAVFLAVPYRPQWCSLPWLAAVAFFFALPFLPAARPEPSLMLSC